MQSPWEPEVGLIIADSGRDAVGAPHHCPWAGGLAEGRGYGTRHWLGLAREQFGPDLKPMDSGEHGAWVIASEELYRRVPTHQNSSVNTLNGPQTSGAWNVGDFQAGPARRGVRLPGRRDAGNLAADHNRHRHRRSGQRNVPNRVPHPEPLGRGPEMPRREPVVGGSGRRRNVLQGLLPWRGTNSPAGQRQSDCRNRPRQRDHSRQRTPGRSG